MVFLIVVLQDKKCLVGMLLKFLILVFQVDKHTKKDSRLAYRKVGKFDNQDIYYAEIRLPRWNKILKDIPLEELNNNIDKYINEDARTMIGASYSY